MKRQFVADLTGQDDIDDVFRVGQKTLRHNRNNNLYLQVELFDKSGSVTGMLWNAEESVYKSFDPGHYIRVKGKSQVYEGRLQIIVHKLNRIANEQVDEADFQVVPQVDTTALIARLAGLINDLEDDDLRALGQTFLGDVKLMNKLSAAPAGVKYHHAFAGGLLSHVVRLMRVAQAVAPFYPNVLPDLLVMGAFLHDIAKIDELNFHAGYEYSDEGQMIGHLVMGVQILEKKIAECEAKSEKPFPEEYKLRLKHIIVSHHGQYEYGSPKLPMTLEAMAIHYLDTMDSKLAHVHTLMLEDPNTDSPWTNYFPALDRKLFKGKGTAAAARIHNPPTPPGW